MPITASSTTSTTASRSSGLLEDGHRQLGHFSTRGEVDSNTYIGPHPTSLETN